MTVELPCVEEKKPRFITNFSLHLKQDTLAMVGLTTYLDTKNRKSIQEVVRVHYHDKDTVSPLTLLKIQKKGEEVLYQLSHYPICLENYLDCSGAKPQTIHLPSNFEEIIEQCNTKLSTNTPYIHNKSGNWYQVITTVKDNTGQEFVIYTCMDKTNFPDNHFVFAREINSFLEQDSTGVPKFSPVN
jgi:Protein of unknown function (DUF1653)